MEDISDTSLDVQNMQIALLRKKSLQERLMLTFAISETTISLAHRALKRSMPESSDDERKIKFVELHYGKELSERFKDYIESGKI